MTNSHSPSSAASEQDYLEDNIATLAHHLAQPGAFLCVHYDGAAKLLVDPGEVLKEASRRLSPEADPPQRSAATEGEIDFNDPLTSRIMGAARLHTHDHTMAYNITRDVLAVLDEPQPAPVTAEPRFFIDHSMIHDRLTGKHVSTEPDSAFCDGVEKCCELLNSLAERREPRVFPLLFNSDWLEDKIKADPDIECDAGPSLARRGDV